MLLPQVMADVMAEERQWQPGPVSLPRHDEPAPGRGYPPLPASEAPAVSAAATRLLAQVRR